MRTYLPILLVSLALILAPVAMADDDGDAPSAGKGKSDAGKAGAAAHRENATHDDDDADNESSGGGRDDANRTAWRENHSAAIESFVAQVKALRASWHENATKVREGCKADDFDHRNGSKENRTAHAHCIRDGYAAWRAEHRADIKEVREQLRALFESWHPKKNSG